MKKNNLIVAREWFSHADEDILSCEAIIKEGGGPSTLCFLSHLIAEKYLKGLLIASGKDLVKIHDGTVAKFSFKRKSKTINKISC